MRNFALSPPAYNESLESFLGELSCLPDPKSVGFEEYIRGIKAAFPLEAELGKETRRMKHVELAIRVFHSLANRQLDLFYNLLPDKIKKNQDPEEIKRLAGRFADIYDSLDLYDRKAAEMTVILHDIALFGGKSWTHNIRGAVRAKEILSSKKGVSEIFIGDVSRMVLMHGCFCDSGVDVLPKDYSALKEKEIPILLLMNICDTTARIDLEGKPYSLSTAEALKSLLALADLSRKGKDSSEFKRFESGFYLDRLKKLVSPKAIALFYEQDNNDINSLIDELIPAEERELFASIWNDSIRIRIFPLFLGIGRADLRKFVKFAKLMHQIANILKERDPELTDIIVDGPDDLDFNAYNGDEKRPYIEHICRIIDEIPDKAEINQVRNHMESLDDFRVFGCPFTFDRIRNILTIELGRIHNNEQETVPGQQYKPLPYKKFSLRINTMRDVNTEFLTADEIEKILSADNWFWSSSEAMVRSRALKRLEQLSARMGEIMATDTFNKFVPNRNEIVAVYTSGSYPWHDEPGDIDIYFIVKGNRTFEMKSLSDEEAVKLNLTAEGVDGKIKKITLQVFGTENLENAADERNARDAEDLQRKIHTMYGNAVRLKGMNILSYSDMPAENFMVLSENLKRLAGTIADPLRRQKRLLESEAIKKFVEKERTGPKIKKINYKNTQPDISM